MLKLYELSAVEHNYLPEAMSADASTFARYLLDRTPFEYHPTAVELLNSLGWSWLPIAFFPIARNQSDLEILRRYSGASRHLGLASSGRSACAHGAQWRR